MDLNNTSLFELKKEEEPETKKILKEVDSALRNKGYNPIHQIVGYLITGDPVYITSDKEAREKIKTLDRNAVIETLLESYLNE